jgi:tRNA (cmo5U34)-methyltransferase
LTGSEAEVNFVTMPEAGGDTASGGNNAVGRKSGLSAGFRKSWGRERAKLNAERRILIAELLPFAVDEPFTFVDLGTGKREAAARAILDRYPAARAVVVDVYPRIRPEGESELLRHADRYAYVQFDLTVAGTWPATIPAQVDAAISSLSVHHLRDDRKRSLFDEILGRLVPGGWYFNYDPVLPPDRVVEEAWLRAGDRRDPSAALLRRHRTETDQLRHENHVRYMTPLDPQVGMLRAAGFEGVDVFWKELDFVIYGGRRPA